MPKRKTPIEREENTRMYLKPVLTLKVIDYMAFTIVIQEEPRYLRDGSKNKYRSFVKLRQSDEVCYEEITRFFQNDKVGQHRMN